MLISLAFIFLLGLALGGIFNRLKLPSLLGMLFTGMILGPYALNLLDEKIILISSDLRQLALVIILTRAGLALNLKDLKKVGRPAILMCFIPALFEIVGVVLLAPTLLGVSIIDAAIMGTVVAAVSPAVIVPRMLKLLEQGYGVKNNIPGLIMAGASVDDVFVIVLFTSFTGLAVGNRFTASSLGKIPISIALGLLVGVLIGLGLVFLFRNVHMRDSTKTVILLGVSFVLIAVEKALEHTIAISGLLAVMSMSGTILQCYPVLAKRLSLKFSKLWVGSELILFVLVGATVNIHYAITAGSGAILVILGALSFRILGVFICLLKTNLDKKERLFCMLAYMPKATVQAAIGSVPLAMGLECGQIVLTVAVLSILITAPLGAMGIDLTYKKFLKKE